MRSYLALLCICCIGLAYSKPDIVRYPFPSSFTRFQDLEHILNRSLEVTQPSLGEYVLQPNRSPMPESRQIKNLQYGHLLDLIWSSTSDDKEAKLLPIRVPLRQGLLGYRLLIINKEQESSWKNVETLSDLQKKVFVQGIGWGDIALYEHSKIKVIAVDYEQAFKVVELNKVDAFPRGITEAFPEVAKYGQKHSNISVEPRIALYYPWPYYFFVKKDNLKLHDRIEKGLNMLVDSGELKMILERYHGDFIKKAQLKDRHLISIENPFLPKTAPLDHKQYWYDLGKN